MAGRASLYMYVHYSPKYSRLTFFVEFTGDRRAVEKLSQPKFQLNNRHGWKLAKINDENTIICINCEIVIPRKFRGTHIYLKIELT